MLPATWVAAALAGRPSGPPPVTTIDDLARHGAPHAHRAQASLGKLLNGVRFTPSMSMVRALPATARSVEQEATAEAFAGHRSLCAAGA